VSVIPKAGILEIPASIAGAYELLTFDKNNARGHENLE